MDRTPAALETAVAPRAGTVALALDEDAGVTTGVVTGFLEAVAFQHVD